MADRGADLSSTAESGIPKTPVANGLTPCSCEPHVPNWNDAGYDTEPVADVCTCSSTRPAVL
jgi:hypothetical protein